MDRPHGSEKILTHIMLDQMFFTTLISNLQLMEHFIFLFSLCIDFHAVAHFKVFISCLRMK